MRFVIRKYIDATTVKEAIDKEPETPIHDCYLKEGEEPPKSQPKDQSDSAPKQTHIGVKMKSGENVEY
jgi:hypothetical protein